MKCVFCSNDSVVVFNGYSVCEDHSVGRFRYCLRFLEGDEKIKDEAIPKTRE